LKKKRQPPKVIRPKERTLTPLRRRLFGMCALVFVPLLAFAFLEGVLRLAGYGYDTAFFKKVQIGGQDFFVNNDDFVRRFFPPQLARLPGALRMEAGKPPQTCRIFILGESAALGDPSPAYGAGRYLQTLLAKQFPAEKFEVINVSITAINSHAILPIARECARHEGDFWIIYMGNNEMVGPFGAASVFGAQAPPVWAVRLSLALQETRVGQAIMATVRHFHFKASAIASWGGMEMFLGHQLPPGDPRKERVYANFKENLHDILQAGLGSGARMILNTVAVNLNDCSPFASVPSNFPPVDLRDFAQAAQHEPNSAALQYDWGQYLLKLPDPSVAQEHFQKACDDDALPFRTDSRINGLIRDAARHTGSTNLVLLDTATLMNSSDENFFEHVHFNFEGNYRLGRVWAEKIASLLPSKPAAPWLEQAACEQRLALTPWNKMVTLSEVARRRQRPPLSSQYNNSRELDKLRREMQTLRGQTGPGEISAARAIYLNAIQASPEDFWLQFDFGDFLEANGDWLEAAALWKKVEEMLPQYYLGYLQEGRMLEKTGQLDEAATAFQKTVELYPRMTVAWFELSNIHTSTGKYELAVQECKRAQQLEPQQPAFYICLGRIFSRMKRPEEAMEQFRRAIQMEPRDKDSHLALAQELSRAGRTDEAKREFQQVLQLDPSNPPARAALP
jgi:tetratricopeptide (TPR) repeat protein